MDETKMDSVTLDQLFSRAADAPEVKVHFWKNKNSISSFSYKELQDKALLVTGKLQKLGVKKGDRVAIVLPTDPTFYHAFFGVIFSGAIAAALYPPVRLGRMDEWKERTAAMLKSIGCKAVITDKKIFNLLGEPVREASPELGCFTVDELQKDNISGNMAKMSSRDLCIIQFSSGTTGSPKPVALSHHNIIRNTHSILSTLPGDITEHSAVSWLPLYHDMGLVGCLFSTMMAKRDLTLIRPEQFIARPKMWLEALTKQKATVSVAPNFAFGLCNSRVSEKDMAELDLSRWKIALCGAEAVHPNTLKNFSKKFASVGFKETSLSPVYGLAEATLAVTFSSLEETPISTVFDREQLEIHDKAVLADEGITLASVGRALPDTEIEIRSSSNKKIDDNAIGRVWVKSDGIMEEYYLNPEATAEIIQDGWLDTGDQGFIHEDNLYLCGRYKDAIIIRGRNYSAADIEHALEELPGVRQGCAAAFSDYIKEEDDSESLVVLVEYRKQQVNNMDELKKQIGERIQLQCNLKAADIVLLEPGTLPRTSSGKIRRNAAKIQWRRNELYSPGKGGLKTVLKESIQGVWQHRQAQRERKVKNV
ncbi:fatty acyl-AMP ligase [Candidatus Uabimicrobium sp. HlEnr_7]|uniref:fatty acyl-AMP ligase n=1 Tax=Candidatus Uabimicrobium helgolandensis TaxID=3095367 RepID=UPI003555F716